ncbi:uncharacterized protein [Apostichopus japonicus]|uniref:uncharacterized protein n=1 Tax=Stichopus japonicus TaxID=307972 RepID=UPI003AB6B087
MSDLPISMSNLLNLLEYSAYALLDYCLDGSRDAFIFEDDNINSCMTMSNGIEENRQKKDIGVISGSIAGVVASGLSLGGMLLLPFTYGASVGLIGAGAALGITGGTVSAGFSLHKFVRDRQKSKTLPTCAAKFVTIREKLAKIAIAINRVLVNVKVLRTSQMWGEFQEQDTMIRRSVVNALTQLWELIQRKNTPSDPENAIDSVLSNAAEVLKAFEDIIEESKITDVKLHPRITEDIEPSSENLDSALQNLCKCGFQEGMNIGKLLLAFFTEQFDDLYKSANLEAIRNTAYPTIASAVNGSQGAVIRPTIDVNGVDEIDGGVQVNGRTVSNYIKIDRVRVNGKSDEIIKGALMTYTISGRARQIITSPKNVMGAAKTAKAFKAARAFKAADTLVDATSAGSATRNIAKVVAETAELSDDVASAGASVGTNTAVKVSRGIPVVGVVFASLGIVTESYSLISHAIDLSKCSKGERERLSKQFYELAVIMALTNTIVSSRGN